MALDPKCVGTTYPPAQPYPVEPQTIRRFAEAVGDPAPVYTEPAAAQSLGHPDVLAPPTFPFIVVVKAMEEVFRYEDIGFDPTYLIHGNQRFDYTRPVRAGDRLVTTLEITGAQTLRGRDVLGLRADLADVDGSHVVTTHMTFVSLSAVEGGERDDDQRDDQR
ncbi:MaoC family dehydratase N-terminal domain-containing protein [Streptomyces sp. NPDC052036]|uniref:FAS1-like dehydratase domain-containing protein n=1 Tax=Streptomyces sp. NPDC052036 TaxID=3155171 RepID=UPI0034355BFF